MNSRYTSAIVVAGLVLTLGGAVSWGQLPPTNDTSDTKGNTGGGTGALGSASLSGPDNTAYGFNALSSNTAGTDIVGAEPRRSGWGLFRSVFSFEWQE